MSVREAQAKIDAQEFAEWRAFYQLEPWTEERGDLRMGILASVIVNKLTALQDVMMGLWSRGYRPPVRKPYQPRDFMPDFDAQPQPQMAPENVHAFFSMLAGAGIGQMTIH